MSKNKFNKKLQNIKKKTHPRAEEYNDKIGIQRTASTEDLT